MRTQVSATLLALSLASGLGVTDLAHADDPAPTPSKQQVRAARRAVADKATDVAGVRRQLDRANARLSAASIAAEQAAEAFNGARWKAQQARARARAARHQQQTAAAALEKQRRAYAASLVGRYSSGQDLSPVAGLVEPGGIDQVQQRSSTMASAQSALDATMQRYQAAKTIADVASRQASAAEDKAVAAEKAARSKREAAQRAATAAAAEARSVAAEKDRLMRQLAHLQHISVALATRRQAALDEQRQRAAEAAAAAAAAAREKHHATHAAPSAGTAPASGAATGSSGAGSAGGFGPTANPPADPAPPSDPVPPSDPASPAPPARSGASAAIAFAKRQLGEPYVWAAAGPDAWDCSGLTMRAWQAGGISLPHYSVAQYEESTPISPADLRPGDLLFWSTTSSPAGIHHVALYIGNGMMIEAPRTGVPVREISMYAWEAPTFYARP